MARVKQTLKRKMFSLEWRGHPHREHRSKKGRRHIKLIEETRTNRYWKHRSKDDSTMSQFRKTAKRLHLPFH